MPNPSRAAHLAAAIDQLLEDFRVYRLLPRPRPKDYDRLVELHAEVTRLALAAGFPPPPPLVKAELTCYNPHDFLTWPADPPPTWRSPNSDAGKEWEREVRSLQTAVRAASEAQVDAADSGRPGSVRRMSATEANEKAKQLMKAHRSFAHRSQREWADAIGCSKGLISKLPLWQETMRRSGRGRKGKAPVPQVVSFTPDLEDVTGEGDREEVLEQVVAEDELKRLIAEQKADREPSPLDDTPDPRPKKVHCRKRL